MGIKNVIGAGLMVLGVFAISKAQDTKTWFRDDFNDNSKNWSLAKNNAIGYEIADGHLIVTSTHDYQYATMANLYMDQNKDFVFEAKLKVEEQKGNRQLGIFITNRDGQKNYFTINTLNKTFWVGTISQNGETISFSVNEPGMNLGWQKSDKINEAGSYNVLKIARKKNQFIFYINDQQVLSTYSKGFCSDIRKYIGIVTFAEAKIAVDYIVFDQDNWKNVLAYDAKPLKAEQLSAAVNTPAEEINPVLTADGKTLYFTRMHYRMNYEGVINSDVPRDGDIYYSEFKNGEWSWAKHLEYGISNKENNTLVSVSPDGNSILLIGAYDQVKHTTDPKGGVSVSSKTKNGWTYPQTLNIKNFTNSSKLVNYFMASDWKTLILAIQGKGSKKSPDLYVSFKQRDNSWSEPKHLGNKINTPDTEFSPFLAPDRRTLYFASWDLPGYGEADMFMTKRLDESWTNWTEPVNLGPAVNNDEFNAYYKVSADNLKVYYASNKDALGGYYCDIFMADLPKELQPDPVVVISGKVLSAKTNEPVEASILYEVLPEGKAVGETKANPATGEYSVILPYGKNYGFFATLEGYIAVEENIDLSAVYEHREMERNIIMYPIEVGQAIKLNNVFFKQGLAQLLPDSYPELDRLVSVLKEKSTMEIEVQGHTDNQGDQRLNVVLSEQRADVVKKYLITKGVNASRITVKGFGGANPIAENDTEQNRKKNRRVEFLITKL